MTARIVVIDDNPDNLKLIELLLKARGHTPLLAGNGTDGILLAVAERPDMILLDIRMPDMDGYQVAAALKGEPSLSRVPIIAVTASAMVGDRERITAAGFHGYIQKPIDPETFTAQVDELLAQHDL
jgi:two-component system cell cycle response regulator